MVGRGRADVARAVGRGRGNRPSGFCDQVAGNRVRGQPQADAGKTGTGEIADCSIRLARHNQRQRAGPEAFGQFEGRGVENAFGSGLSERGDMGNQRVELRAAFGGIERGNGRGLGGIRAQTIDGLGRKTDKPA